MEQFPEMPFDNFYSNRNKASFIPQLQEIFKDEFNLIRIKYNSKISVTRAWSVTYDKGHYHVPHNHSSQGYTAIMYLQMKKIHQKQHTFNLGMMKKIKQFYMLLM